MQGRVNYFLPVIVFAMSMQKVSRVKAYGAFRVPCERYDCPSLTKQITFIIAIRRMVEVGKELLLEIIGVWF